MFRGMHTRFPYRNRYSFVLFCLFFSLLATFGAAQAAPQTPTAGPGPIIYVPNESFAITNLRDSNSYDVLSSLAIPVANTSAINHSTDGSLLYSVSRGFNEQFEVVDQFSVIDVTTQSLLGSVDLPFRGVSNCTASTVVALPDNSKAYVACEGNGFVEVIHMNLALGQVTLGTPIYTGWPKSAQFVNGSVYVSNTQSNTITRIDPLTDETEAVVNANPFIIQDAVVDPFRPYTYIVHIFNNRILIGNTVTHGISRTLSFAGQPIDLLLSPDGERLYVTVDNGEGNGQDHIAIVEGLGSAESIVATIPVGEAASYLSSNDEGSCVFAWDFVNGVNGAFGSRRIDVIDTATAQLSAQPIVSGGDADGDFVGPGAASLAVYLEPNNDSQNTFTVGEGAGSIQLLVRRGCSSQGTVQVNYATQAANNGYDAAVDGEDFQAVSGTLTFAEGELTKIIEIPLINDDLYSEPTRSFALVLSDPVGALLGSRSVDTVNIEDDDAIPAGSDLELYLSEYPSPVTAGDELVYYINLNNYPTDGGGAAEDVVVIDELPAGVTFVSAEVTVNDGGGGGGGDFSAASIDSQGTTAQSDTLPQPGMCDTPAVGESGSVTCNVGTLNPAYEGVSADITIRVQVSEAAADSDLLNTATVTSSTFDPYPNNNSASVTTHVDAPVGNQPPLAVDDSASLDEDSSLSIDVLGNDSDPDNDPLAISQVDAAQSGVAEIVDTTILYTPQADTNGQDQFTYTVSDGNGGSASATVYITVNAVNDNPVASDDSATTPQDTPATIAVLANDSDVDSDPLTVSAVGAASNGSVTTDGNSVTYTPSAGFSGADSFSYTISDGQNGSANATVNLTVTPAQAAQPRITIVLDSQPDRNLNVRFDGTGPIRRFRLDDITPQDADALGSSKSFALEAGSYTVTETVRNGWFLTDITCSPAANTTVDLANKRVTLNVANGDDVTCTFVNQKAGIIRAKLFHDRNGNGTRQGREPFNRDWTVNLLDAQNVQVATRTTNANGKVSFTNVRPGDYTVCEVLQDGLTHPQPCQPVQIGPNQIAELIFANLTDSGVNGASLNTNIQFSEGADSSSEEDEEDEGVAPNDDAWLQTADAAMDHILFLSVVSR